MAKVFLGVGHGGSDPGAQGGGLDEADINLGIAVACQAELVRHGVQVRMSRTRDEDDPLTEEIRECNAYDPDLAVDIHTNAGGGVGFEVYHTLGGGKGKTLAQNIETEVKAIGQTSRGCKTKANSSGTDYYGFIRQTKCPAVICECAFIDTAADRAKVDTADKQAAFGRAYARGILKTLGIEAGEDETVQKIILEIDGGQYLVEAIEKNGVNYVKLRSFEQAGYVVGWDNQKRLPSIRKL